MSPFSIISDSVTGPHTNPLGNRPVFLLGFGKLLLCAKGLVTRHIGNFEVVVRFLL